MTFLESAGSNLQVPTLLAFEKAFLAFFENHLGKFWPSNSGPLEAFGDIEGLLLVKKDPRSWKMSTSEP